MGAVSPAQPGTRDVGRAISITPRREINAPICCERVKGSLMRIQHAAQATLGARKVITVASAIGRYRRESVNGKTQAQPRTGIVESDKAFASRCDRTQHSKSLGADVTSGRTLFNLGASKGQVCTLQNSETRIRTYSRIRMLHLHLVLTFFPYTSPYVPPKKPPKPRATSSPLTSFLPNGASGMLAKYR